MSEAPRIAVVGAGWLGAEVARRAAAGGRRVRASTRSGDWRGADPAPAGVETVAFDVLADRDAGLRTLLDGAGAAVFCWAPSQGTERRRLYVEGAAVITRVCGASNLARVVYTSSTSALPDVDGWVDEEEGEWPESDRGRIQRDAEECLGTGLGRAGVPWVILRLAGLYGGERELARIYGTADADRVRAGDGMERTNLVHREDAVAAVLAALELPASWSGVVHVCDDDHRTRREVTAAVARAAGHPPPRWEEPSEGRAPRGKQVSNERMKRILGVRLRHPWHEA